MSGPHTENARLPNWVFVQQTMADLLGNDEDHWSRK